MGNTHITTALDPAKLKLRMFCEDIIRTNRPVEALLRLGMETDRHSAVIAANRLKSTQYVKDTLLELAKRMVEKGRADANAILAALENIGMVDPVHLHDEQTGANLSIHDIPEHVRRCIEQYDIIKTATSKEGEFEYSITRVKFAPRTPALKVLAEAKGLLASLVVNNYHVSTSREEVAEKMKHFLDTQEVTFVGLLSMLVPRVLIQRLIDGDESAKVEAQAMLVEVK